MRQPTIAYSSPQSLLDRFGAVASSLCAIHCITLPWILIALPAVSGSWLTSQPLERAFVLVSIVLASLCSIQGFRTHGRWLVPGATALGAMVLAGSHATAPEICCAAEISWPHAISATLGGALLASGHLLNLRWTRNVGSAPCCSNDSCPAHD